MSQAGGKQMPSFDDVSRALAAAQLTELAGHVEALTRPAIRLSLKTVEQSAAAIGASRIGGQPDMPPGTVWPSKQGAPMSFAGQIRLEETAPYDAAHLLPAAGLLAFFYDAGQETYGADPGDRAGFQVLYFAGELANLQRQPFPEALPATARFQPCAVTCAATLTAAQAPDLEIPGLAWSPDAQKRYEAAIGGVAGLASQPQGGPHSQLLGFPDTLQDDMRMECQLASHGIGMDQADSDPRTTALAAGATNWQLLLQLDSEPQAGMRWADAGMLYYWVERDALRAGTFDNVWVVLQSD